MALSATQKVTVAEIARETYATVDSLASNLTAEQETAIIADIATWNLNRDDVDFELDSEGVNIKAVRLLDAIRERVRKHLGLSLVSSEVSGASQSIPHTWIF